MSDAGKPKLGFTTSLSQEAPICPGYPTFSPTVVHQLAHETLTSCMAWEPGKRCVQPKQAISAVLIAGPCRAFFATSRRFSGLGHNRATVHKPDA